MTHILHHPNPTREPFLVTAETTQEAARIQSAIERYDAYLAEPRTARERRAKRFGICKRERCLFSALRAYEAYLMAGSAESHAATGGRGPVVWEVVDVCEGDAGEVVVCAAE